MSFTQASNYYIISQEYICLLLSSQLFPSFLGQKQAIVKLWSREKLSDKQTQLLLIRYKLSTCNNGAAITRNALCPSLAPADTSRKEWNSVTRWITDKSLGNHGGPTTLKPFIDFCMLLFSDERDIFNGLWLLLSEDHVSLDWGFEGQIESKKKERKKRRTSVLIITSFLLDIHCLFLSLCLMYYCVCVRVCVWVCDLCGIKRRALRSVNTQSVGQSNK